MIIEVNTVNFRRHLDEMLNRVQYCNDCIVINNDGKPIAALVGAELFARICRMRERFDILNNQIAKAYADMIEVEGVAEIDAAVAGQRQRD